MRKRITIDVSGTDRDTRTAIVTDRNSPQRHVWRAQIVLLTADGCGTMELTRRTARARRPCGVGKNGSWPKACPVFRAMECAPGGSCRGATGAITKAGDVLARTLSC
jgi:hypothetical protein